MRLQYQEAGDVYADFCVCILTGGERHRAKLGAEPFVVFTSIRRGWLESPKDSTS